MGRLTLEDLRRSTLQRQFPRIEDRDRGSIRILLELLGPIQSQVPRAPFLHLAARMPGIDHATITAAFESHELVKTSSIRGTVHTSIRQHYGWLDAVARAPRTSNLRRELVLQTLSPADVADEIESFCADGWRSRDTIVVHVQAWLERHDSATSAQALTGTFPESLVWGHSGLIRRPRDEHWDKRTDIYHRTARSVLPDVSVTSPEIALAELVRVHLGACGPLTREDLAFFFGVGLGQVDRAVSALDEEVTRQPGPDRDEYLDLAAPPIDGDPDPGLKLLPAFETLLVGLHRRHRTRFIAAHQLPRVWARANGLFSPVVLFEGRLVASWKTVTQGGRTDIEVVMLDPCPFLTDDLFDPAVRAVEQALNVTIGDLRLRGGD